MLGTSGLSLLIQIPLILRQKNPRIAAVAEASILRPGCAKFYKKFSRYYDRQLAIQKQQRSMAIFAAIGSTALAIDDYVRPENQAGFYQKLMEA